VDLRLPQETQFAEHAYRVVAGAQEVLVGAEDDAPTGPATGLGGNFVLGGRGGRRFRGRCFCGRRPFRGWGRRLGGGLGGVRLTVEHGLQAPLHLSHLGLVHGGPGLGRFDHLAQQVHGIEQQVHRLLGHLAPPFAHLVQQGLHDVGELGHLGEAEGGAPALDGMGGAEDGVNGIGIDGPRVQPQEGRFHAVQALQAFFEEGLVELGDVDAHGLTPERG